MPCSGRDRETGDPCTCLKYQEPTDLPKDGSVPLRCLECCHGQSLHPQAEDTDTGKKVSSVLALLKKSYAPPTSVPKSMAAARSETNAGFRPSGGEKSSTTSAGSQKVLTKKASVLVQYFHGVNRLMLLDCSVPRLH